MRFYQLQVDPYTNLPGDCRWFTSRAEAKKEQRKLEREGCDVYFTVYDIPTKKAELLRWLNAHGHPFGFGIN
jgi:hypothetical protein